uniref:Uncharacterized protein n=1 Tax=Terrapene triunguis TaxID=2587831 RepID=A0A674J9J3_9SAUR
RQPLSLAWGAHGAPSPWPPEPRGLRPRNRAGGRRPTTPALTRTRRPAAPRLSPGPLPAQAPLGRSAPSEPRWPERAGGGPEPGPEPATPSTGPPIQFGASDKLVGVSREWELLPPPRPSLAPQPRALALGPAACPPAEPSAYSGERGPSQRPYPELFYGSQPGVAQVPSVWPGRGRGAGRGAGRGGLALCLTHALCPPQQVPSPPVESQLNGSFRPGTPSLHPYRSQHLYLQPGPAPGSPAAPVLPGSALLSGVALKGQYVEFSALQAAELAKLPATGLLYQAPPPLPHSPPLRPRPPGPRAAPAPGAAGAEPPLGFLPGLPATGQPEQLPSGPGPRPAGEPRPQLTGFAPGPAPCADPYPPLQMLLPMVESQLPPVVNFGSLQQGAPAAPPPLPLVPVTPALRPPGQLAGRLVPSAVRAFPHGMGRTEVRRGPGWGAGPGRWGAGGALADPCPPLPTAAPHGDEALPRVPEVQQSWGSSPSGGQVSGSGGG